LSLEIRPIQPEDWPAAAQLLASRHTFERRSQPLLPSKFEDPTETISLVAAMLEAPASSGVIAWSDGEPVGFMAGLMRTPSPFGIEAKYARSRAAFIPYAGHAIADPDDGELYRQLYAAIAPEWLERGFFSHYIEVAALDYTASDAFVSLGFGRQTTLAARRVSEPVAGEKPLDLDILRAGPSELDTVMEFVSMIAAHHAAPPSFLPYLREPDAEIRESVLGWLNDWSNAYLLARREGKAVGMFGLRQHGYEPELARPERTIYLDDGAVAPSVRRGGVGIALLREGMQWAHEAGFTVCLLHFLSANLAGSRFWQANGYWPVVHTLARHVDERIVWAHG
jgi:GNAT superfamily N-acetyltransferase